MGTDRAVMDTHRDVEVSTNLLATAADDGHVRHPAVMVRRIAIVGQVQHLAQGHSCTWDTYDMRIQHNRVQHTQGAACGP